MFPAHFGIRFCAAFDELILQLAATGLEAAKTGAKNLRPRRKKSYRALHPGVGTPLWNACRPILRAELRVYGAKVRLARYLGIPKQRISDFVAGGRRMPDAETLLRLLHWIAVRRTGRDFSI